MADEREKSYAEKLADLAFSTSPPANPTAPKLAQMDDIVVFVASELVAFPFCFNGAEAFMNGRFRQGVIAYIIGLPFALLGLSYPFWKRYVGERWRRWLFAASTLVLPVGLIIAFVYIVGPVIYWRANMTRAAPNGAT